MFSADLYFSSSSRIEISRSRKEYTKAICFSLGILANALKKRSDTYAPSNPQLLSAVIVKVKATIWPLNIDVLPNTIAINTANVSSPEKL